MCSGRVVTAGDRSPSPVVGNSEENRETDMVNVWERFVWHRYRAVGRRAVSRVYRSLDRP